MTAREKLKKDHPDWTVDQYQAAIRNNCPDIYGCLPASDTCLSGANDAQCRACWDREIPEEKPNTYPSLVDEDDKELPEDDSIEGKFTIATPRILDSGNRREFETGAVRDIQEGKGRCDLLPLDVVAEYFRNSANAHDEAIIPELLSDFQRSGIEAPLYVALGKFAERHFKSGMTMLLELAIHFEEGAKKYGDNNWQKGIPVRCYIDSAVRHYLKFLRGDKDEPHDRAFCWNIMCAIWTCKHKPELNEYEKLPKDDLSDDENMEAPV